MGQLGPAKVTLKNTPEGWHQYDKRSDEWRELDPDVEITYKKPLRSGIAQVPSDGYVQRDNFSKASIQWLEYQMELARRKGETLNIRHALNGGEVPIMGTRYKVDRQADNVVYEYHGKCNPRFSMKKNFDL